ncbi:MAG: AAA family ATPase, partial [Candidatus Riesia sp.]|nr:AAA family ATPase [Candidatus Riesia sp.]
MLKLLQVEANDFLCYGKLSLDVTKYSLVQLVADNGAGKTNILSIITEALYGKNPRGYAKGELFNRNTNATKYSISVKFTKDGSTYIATTN